MSVEFCFSILKTFAVILMGHRISLQKRAKLNYSCLKYIKNNLFCRSLSNNEIERLSSDIFSSLHWLTGL